MSKRVVDSPKKEAKELFYYAFDESWLFDNFFDDARPPDGVSEKDYMEELEREYYKLKIEETRRILGLDKK